MTIKRGILQTFNAGSHTATVQLEGSLGNYLTLVPVSRGLDSAELNAGDAIAVEFFDDANPTDCVLVAVWTP